MTGNCISGFGAGMVPTYSADLSSGVAVFGAMDCVYPDD